MELLAPAGNLECALAALKYGADAVYLGLKSFSARVDAENFLFEDLQTLVGVAHGEKPRRRVFVTVNTLLREDELPQMLEMLSEMRRIGVDGLIIQDWAVYGIVREFFPEYELHASTQLAIHSYAGALQARDLGFKRVVLARELTMDEVRAISAIPGLETEVFIHGALCYAYSGLCLLSAVLRGNSGNRGNCDYVCRAHYSVKCPNERKEQLGNIMSMKDLWTGDMVEQFAQAGVTSLKIEGRKKTPLYVSAVTNYYRKLLDGRFAPGEQTRCEEDIKSIFSRPWTPFHYKARHQLGITDIHTVGHRGVEAGIVANVMAGEPDRVRFIVKNHPVEKHDGLQIELPTRDKPYGFPVDEIRVFPQRNNDTWKHAFLADVGLTIEVPLPVGHPDIPVGARIFCSSSQDVKRRYDWENVRPALCRQRTMVDMSVTLTQDGITASATLASGVYSGLSVLVSMPVDGGLSPARDVERVERTVQDGVAKLGDTEYELANAEIRNPDGLFAPVSMINEVRRQVTARLDAAIAARARADSDAAIQKIAQWKAPAQTTDGNGWILQIDKAFYLNVMSEEDIRSVDEVIFSLARTPANELDESLELLLTRLGNRSRIRLALPPVVRPDAGIFEPGVIARLYRAGWRRWQCANIGSVELLRQYGAPPENLNLTADWTLFATNTRAVKELLEQGYRSVTFAPDDTIENWKQMLAKVQGSAVVPVYQDTPLAISDVCAMASLKEHCPGRDRCRFDSMMLANPAKGESLIAINNRCQSVFINELPFTQQGHLNELRSAGARHFRMDFCWRDYTPLEVRRVFREFLTEDHSGH